MHDIELLFLRQSQNYGIDDLSFNAWHFRLWHWHLPARLPPQLRPGRRTFRIPGALATSSITVVAVALIASAAVIMLSLRQIAHEQHEAQQALTEENRARVLSFQQHVLRLFAMAELAARHVERQIDGSGPISRQDLVDTSLPNPRLFSGVAFYTPRRGLVVYPSPGLSAATVRQLRRYAAGPGPIAVSPPLEVAPGRFEIAFIRRRRPESDSFVAIFIEPRRFTEFADHFRFAPRDLISLIGLDGITRARRTGDRFTSGELIGGLAMKRQLAAPNGNYVGPSVLDGIPRFFSHQRLSDFGLFATSGMPLSTIAERTSQRRQSHYNTMAAGILAIMLIAALVLRSLRYRELRLVDALRANRRFNEAQRIGMMGDWDYFPANDSLHWSINLRRMYGKKSRAPSRLADIADRLSPSQFADIRKNIDRVMADGNIRRWEFDITLAEGVKSRRRVIAGPIRDDSGRIVGVHGTDQDVTHEGAMREMEQRLTELARLDSLSAVAATLAHEINQPLGVAANYLGAASSELSRVGAANLAARYVQRASDQIEHLAGLVQGVRDLTSRERSGSSLADLNISVARVVEMLADTQQADIRLVPDVPAETRWLKINQAQLTQILFNLAQNSVEAACPIRQPVISIFAKLLPNDCVEVSLSDNSGGFPPEVQDPFAAMSTSKTAGLGLGLALSRTIIEARGGRIWIAKSTADGSTVVFTLPAAMGNPLDEA